MPHVVLDPLRILLAIIAVLFVFGTWRTFNPAPPQRVGIDVEEGVVCYQYGSSISCVSRASAPVTILTPTPEAGGR